MANNPQKSNESAKDPLTAIEDALRARDSDPGAARPAIPIETAQRPQRPAEDLFQSDLPSVPWAEDGNGRRAANDDRAAIGTILQTLQRKPARTPYVAAAALSAL